MLEVSSDFDAAVRTGARRWTGDAADAYRRHTGTVADLCRGFAGVASSVAKLTRGTAQVGAAVRDILAPIASSLVIWTAELLFSVGVAEPLVEAQATRAIARVVDKVAELVLDLENVVDAALTLLSALMNIIDGLSRRLQELRIDR